MNDEKEAVSLAAVAWKNVIELLPVMVPAFIGGLLDYARQIQQKIRKFNIAALCLHCAAAIFFGWVVNTWTVELGYSVEAAKASGGVGGWIGVRFADLIISAVRSKLGLK